jgi:hypothetical protein
MNLDTKHIEETRQRTIRIETRLVTLASLLGFDLTNETHFTVNAAERKVMLNSLDIVLTTIMKACRREGIRNERVALIYRDQCIGELYL